MPLWTSPLGERVRSLEAWLLEPALTRVHGENVLWIGRDKKLPDSLSPILVGSAGRMAIYLTTEVENSSENAGSISRLVSNLDQLPFQSSSIDAVVLHHSLEEATDPRVVLREVFRVLTPGGRLVVCGFTPWSLLGLRRGYARVVRDVMSKQRLVNPIRLFDWFTLLGFELDAPPMYDGMNLFFNRVAKAAPVSQPSHQLPFGSVLVTSAVKQVNSYTFRPGQFRSPNSQLAPVSYPRFAHWTGHKAVQDENPQTK